MQSMRANLRELWQFRELLLSMIEREIRIRYKNSFFGFFWSLLNPLITIAVMTLVFKYLLGNPMPSFSAYILAAYLPYMFFQLAVMDSAQSVIGALPVVRKTYFPREILPLAPILSNFLHFILALGVFFVFRLVVWMFNPGAFPLTWNLAWLPVLLVIQLTLTTGVGLIVSALNTFYEDVKYIVGVMLYLMFFLCPIMYFSETVYHSRVVQENSWLYTAYHMNPVATLATAYRKVLVPSSPVWVDGRYVAPLPMDWTLLGITAAFSVLVLVGGYALFNRLKPKFVERP